MCVSGRVFVCERESPPETPSLISKPSKVDVRLPEKGDSNPHGARPVHQIITMIYCHLLARERVQGYLSTLGPRVIKKTKKRRSRQLKLCPSRFWRVVMSSRAGVPVKSNVHLRTNMFHDAPNVTRTELRYSDSSVG